MKRTKLNIFQICLLLTSVEIGCVCFFKQLSNFVIFTSLVKWVGNEFFTRSFFFSSFEYVSVCVFVCLFVCSSSSSLSALHWFDDKSTMSYSHPTNPNASINSPIKITHYESERQIEREMSRFYFPFRISLKHRSGTWLLFFYFTCILKQSVSRCHVDQRVNVLLLLMLLLFDVICVVDR